MKRAYPKKTKIENYFGMFKVVVKKFILKVPIFRQIIFFINPSLLLTIFHPLKDWSFLSITTKKLYSKKTLSDNLFLIKKIKFLNPFFKKTNL